MKKIIALVSFFISLSCIAGPPLSIENRLFRISVPDDFKKEPRVIVTHKGTGISRLVVPQLHIAFSQQKPHLLSSSQDGQAGVIGWKMSDARVEQDLLALGGFDITAIDVRLTGSTLQFIFPATEAGVASLTVSFSALRSAPSFVMGFTAEKEGWYSIGFTGLKATDPGVLDFVYQPLSWAWKRFPSAFAITEEAYANTAATFISHDGFTEGIAAAPEMIPYRFAYSLQWNSAGDSANKFWRVFPANGPKGNSLFGLAVRNNKGLAQPQLFAPLFGGERSYLTKNQHFQFTCAYLLAPGSWSNGVNFLLTDIFKYRNERQNALASLNQTLDNMLAFAMNDVYSGWVKDLKASDYSFDVPGTVKNVSALHALGLAFVTGNENIYKLRALPMMEYVMSREKFLFSVSDTPGQSQSPSHFLYGPCVDIGELSGLAQMTAGQTPAFEEELKRLFGKSRKLNMETETGGGSWQDHLARYRLLKDGTDLQKAKEGAEDYLKQVYDQYAKTFHDAPGLKDKGANFTTDFGYRIYDLLEIYEATSVQRFLDAAIVGARQLLLWTRSNPSVPDTSVLVNAGGKVEGIFPGRRTSNREGSPFVAMDVTTYVPEQKVPAWQTSLNGLIPEGPGTYAFGPVMLAHHAPWLLRLAKLSGDTLFRNAAYNAVVGRYANFPGYYFTSLHTNVYQRQDYPMHPFLDVKYNAMFYNHVWPHLAMLVDFLVSDFYYRSAGKIDFPSVYAPGYAFLTTKVYGGRPGTFMGNKNVRLWLPQQAVFSSAISFNHLMGSNGKDLFIALANTSPVTVSEKIRLNASVVPWSSGKTYKVMVYHPGGRESQGLFKDGLLQVNLPANGFVAYKIIGLHTPPMLLQQADMVAAKKSSRRFLRLQGSGETEGTATAMMLQISPAFADFYIYSDRTEKQWQSASLRYRIGREDWQEVKDNQYPFEFEVHLADPAQKIAYQLIGTAPDGKKSVTQIQTLND
jgi:hypothetical protein